MLGLLILGLPPPQAGRATSPLWMEHMDAEWEKRKFDAPLLKAKPSEYMKCGRVFISCEPKEKTLPYVAQWRPADRQNDWDTC